MVLDDVYMHYSLPVPHTLYFCASLAILNASFVTQSVCAPTVSTYMWDTQIVRHSIFNIYVSSSIFHFFNLHTKPLFSCLCNAWTH